MLTVGTVKMQVDDVRQRRVEDLDEPIMPADDGGAYGAAGINLQDEPVPGT
jgi:hypothetical protein